MASKRANVPSGAFGKAPGALEKLTGRALAEEPALPQDSETGIAQSSTPGLPEGGNTVLQQNSEAVRSNTEKFTIYISPEQQDKLDELALAYRKRTGKRINRNVIMRKLIDICDLELLLQSNAE
jgi:hypothetical protein